MSHFLLQTYETSCKTVIDCVKLISKFLVGANVLCQY